MRLRMGVLTISLCLALTACGGGAGISPAEQLALDIRGELLETAGCTAQQGWRAKRSAGRFGRQGARWAGCANGARRHCAAPAIKKWQKRQKTEKSSCKACRK